MEICSALRSERGGSRREREQKYHCSLVYAMQFRPQDVMLLKSRGVSRTVSWVHCSILDSKGVGCLQESVNLGGYGVSKAGETTVELRSTTKNMAQRWTKSTHNSSTPSACGWDLSFFSSRAKASALVCTVFLIDSAISVDTGLKGRLSAF